MWEKGCVGMSNLTRLPLTCLSQSRSSQCEHTLSLNSVDVREDNNTLTTDLETQTGCVATIDTTDYGFDES